MKLRPGMIAVFAALMLAANAGAQQLILKDGRHIPVTKMRRSGVNLLVPMQVGTSTGEVGYPLDTVVRAEFPEPAQVPAATDLIGQGKFEEALAQLGPQLDFFQPIAEIPGSWWPKLALLKASALEKSGRATESGPLLDQVIRTAKEPGVVELARLRLSRTMVSQGKYKEAQALCDAILEKYAHDGAIAAEAWLCSGDAWMAQRQYEPALQAYLHIPALYARQTVSLPPALLGSARAYLALKDLPHATATLTEITTDFPSSAEAKTAAEELKRLAETKTESLP